MTAAEFTEPLVPLPAQDMPAAVLVTLQLNGEPVSVAVPPNWTLLELLRYGLGLTGTKQGCDKGDCGTCTVRIDGEPQLACLTLAVEVRDRHVETVEGLGVGGEPHPLIEAGEAYFLHSYAFEGDEVVATTDHEGPVTAAIGRDNMVGVQFHPEKSQRYGLDLLARFLSWRP